ncbi:MAG TPA: PilZ domain-containing protein [Anaeromyxobacteraceae bacterium]|nr:PilZ domain-containing protein [Anaeromyxobacteraceae bacterium]
MGRARSASVDGDRRAAPRLDKVFPVYIDGSRGGALGVARNISAGGLFVETRDPEPLGSQVRITVPAEGGEMTAVGEVRYVCHLVGRLGERAPRPAAVRGMGVRFMYFEAEGTRPSVVH